MLLKVAELSDIDDVLELHYKYQVDSIKEEDKKMVLLQHHLQKNNLQV